MIKLSIFSAWLAVVVCVQINAQSTGTSEISPHFRSAVAHEKAGDIDKAIEEYKLAIQDTPSHADSHYNLGRLLAEKGDFEGAIAQFRDALKLAPNDADIH